MANELDKCLELCATKDTIIELKNNKIAILTSIEQLRADQLIQSNTDLAIKSKEIKRLKMQLVVVKSASILAILGTIYLMR